MTGMTLAFVIILAFFAVVRGFSVYVRRRVLRSKGMNYRGGLPGDPGAFWQPGSGHHGHHAGGWGGGDGGGHHG